jgi:hypothetical protein
VNLSGTHGCTTTRRLVCTYLATAARARADRTRTAASRKLMSDSHVCRQALLDRTVRRKVGQSGSARDACLGGMHVTYVAITILAALANGYAASLDFVGAESVKIVADRIQVSRRWMVPLGALLASGAVGLLVGFAVPALGVAAAVGLVVYFICAVTAHVRVRDRQIGGAVFFLLLAAAALTANVGYHNHW